MVASKFKVANKHKQRARDIVDDMFIPKENVIDVTKKREGSEIELDSIIAELEKKNIISIATPLSRKPSGKIKNKKKGQKVSTEREGGKLFQRKD